MLIQTPRVLTRWAICPSPNPDTVRARPEGGSSDPRGDSPNQKEKATHRRLELKGLSVGTSLGCEGHRLQIPLLTPLDVNLNKEVH